MNDVMISFKDDAIIEYLSKEDIRKSCPLAFHKKPTNPEVSTQYLFVNTETILDDLAKLNWSPVVATQRKSRGKNTIFSKHMIAFQNPDIKIKSKDGDDAFPRIILTNAHDGTQSFRFSVGIYRLICSNGLVIADEEFSDFKIRHKGYTFDELRTVVSKAVSDLPNKVEVMNTMRDRILTEDEQSSLAVNALLIRCGIKVGSEEAAQRTFTQETIKEVLEPTRDLDRGDDLWTVFNVIQEKITQGGFHSALKGVKVRKVRKIASFEKDLEVNKELFKLATSLL
jgi:hypothetical protein